MISRLFTKKKKVRLSLNNKKIVCIGGGTGLFSLLSGLKEYVTCKDNIKAIVTTLDSGGSSGKLRTQFRVLPPGDIRNCLVALSSESNVLNELFQYRFKTELDQHNFGNLLITALTEMTGSFNEAVKNASKILRIKGEVVPVSFKDNHLIAELEDSGELIEGEGKICDLPNESKIKKLSLKKQEAENPRVIEVLKNADLIIFGPGGLHNSILPNILFEEVRKAILNNKKAKKVYFPSVMSNNVTAHFKLSDFKNELESYLGEEFDYIIVNKSVPASMALKKYAEEGKFPVPIDLENLDKEKVICTDLINEDILVRHDPKKVAKEVLKLI